MNPWESFIGSYDSKRIARCNLDRKETVTADWISIALTLIAIPLLVYMFSNFPLFCEDEANNDIMYVIDSPLLRGRNDLVARYSTFVSFLAQCVITACGFCIIALKTMTIAMTLLYLTHPRFWDMVSEAKYTFKERGAAGDWLSTLVSYFTPDIRKYSEYGDVNTADRMYEIGGIQTIGSYVKSNCIQFVVLITLASILWSGKLLKLVGALSQGCVAVVDWALQIDYTGKVTGMLEADRDYQFSFDKNTDKGKNQLKVAQAIYSQVKTAVSDNRTSSFLNSAGIKIENAVKAMTDPLANDQAHVKWDNPTLTFSITWNSAKPSTMTATTAPTTPTNGVWAIPMCALFENASKDGEVSTKQQQMYQNGVIYISFSAQKLYSEYKSTMDKNKDNPSPAPSASPEPSANPQ